MKNKLIVYAPPHLHQKGKSVNKIMWMVIAGLIPAGAAGIFIFGLKALWVIILGAASAVMAEAVLQLLTKRKFTALDGSAVLTGLLLAYNLPAGVPFWIPVAGSFFSIAIAKQVSCGSGHNIFNPALAGRVFLMAFWPGYMATFTAPMNYDAITQATPLALLKEGRILGHISYWDLLLGKKGGCIGEVCILALLAGAAFLLYKGYISWHIPISYVATVGIFTYIFGPKGLFSGDWLFHILSGGLILGAFFMASDYATSPLTRKGHIIFGIGCGLLTAIIRLWSRYPEGVSYAILMMNAATPLIDRYTKNRAVREQIAEKKGRAG